jgi:membrane protein
LRTGLEPDLYRTLANYLQTDRRMHMKKALKYLGFAAILGLVARKEPKEHDSTTAPGGSDNEKLERDECVTKSGVEPGERPNGIVAVVKRTFSDFMDDDCMSLSATIAYYTLFSLPPLLLLLISIAGMVFGREAVQHQLESQISGLIGSSAGGQVQTMVASAGSNKSGGILGVIFGTLALIFGATGAFVALQEALNKAWHVKPDPKMGGIRAFIGKRVLSFGAVVAVGFLLLVSLAVSAALAAFGKWVSGYMPSGLSVGLLHVVGEIVSFLVITVLFASILKFLPDGKIAWREVWVGAALTAALFTLGKTGIGLYLGKTGAASPYGAAGSVILIVLWLYYASLIFLMGAEFTKVWAVYRGHPIEPEKGALRFVTKEHHQR